MIFNEYLTIVLTKMCEYVGAKYENINFDDPKWYYQNSWGMEKEKEFEDWLTDYLYSNKKAREELMVAPLKNKSIIKSFSSFFVFNYGWKLSGE